MVVAANGTKGLEVARERRRRRDRRWGIREAGFAWSLLGIGGHGAPTGRGRSRRPASSTRWVPRSRSSTTTPTRSRPLPWTRCPAGPSGGRPSRRCLPSAATSRCTTGHGVAPNDRERPFLRPELGAGTLTGSAEAVRERIAALEAAGVTEFVYAPMGAEVAHELETMARAVGLDGS